MTSLQARNRSPNDSGFVKPLEELGRAIDVHLQSSHNLGNLYYLRADNPVFTRLRTELFYEAKMYVDRIFQKTLGAADTFRNISATSHEARALSSSRLLHDLSSYGQKVEAGVKTLVIQYTKFGNRLRRLEKKIEAERKQVFDSQGYGMLKAISSWFSRGNDSSQDLQNMDILLSTIQIIKSAVSEMQLFLTSLWNLTSVIGTGRLDTVFKTTSNQRCNLSYSEVNGLGKTIVDECARLRNVCKEVLQTIYSLRVTVPDEVRTAWFWEVEAS